MKSRRSSDAPRAMLVRLSLVLFLAGAIQLPCPAWAGPQEDKLLRLLKKRPRKMTRDTWLEQRREAARELGRKKDRRAVPFLLKIINKERFDVILEIAIDALGEIGDKRAVASLKKLLDDPSVDSYVRDAVAGALKKLGTGVNRPKPRPKPRPGPKPGPKPDPKPDDTLPQPDGPPKVDLADRLVKETRPFGELPAMNLELEANLLARVDRWDIIAGSANVRYDGAAERTFTAFGIQSKYFRQVERKPYGYTIDGKLDFDFRLVDTGQTDASWDLNQGIQINPEIRYYPFRQDLPLLFGQMSGGIGYGLNLAAHEPFLDRRLNFTSTLSVGGGPGYGRIVDIGARLRLRRLKFVLKKAGVLSSEIDKAIGDQIIYAWYKQRNVIGTYAHLGHTLNILRRAGLLAKDHLAPDLVYRVIRILDDPQFFDRPSGLMARLGYGYAHSFIKDADDTEMGFLYLTGEYHHQWVARSFSGGLRFYYQMLGEPDTYGLSVQAAFSQYLYNKNFDPLGALSATIEGGFSRQPGSVFDDGGLASRILVGGSYTRYFNRGTRLVAAVSGGLERGDPLVLVTLEAQYGLARGSFSASE